jgi:hypothetical protein
VTTLDLADPRWADLKGGYRMPYDPRPALHTLAEGHDDGAVFDELWEELHHQGDVGDASYAAVPELLRIHRRRGLTTWQTYALAGTIEIERVRRGNPPIPDWIRAAYEVAWRDVVPMMAIDALPSTTDETTVRCLLGVVSLAKSMRLYGELLLHFDESEVREFVSQVVPAG